MAETDNETRGTPAQPHYGKRKSDCSIDAGELAANGHCWGLTPALRGARFFRASFLSALFGD